MNILTLERTHARAQNRNRELQSIDLLQWPDWDCPRLLFTSAALENKLLWKRLFPWNVIKVSALQEIWFASSLVILRKRPKGDLFLAFYPKIIMLPSQQISAKEKLGRCSGSCTNMHRRWRHPSSTMSIKMGVSRSAPYMTEEFFLPPLRLP